MKSYTFEIIDERSKNEEGLYDIFLDTVIDKDLIKYQTIVKEKEEARMDLLCKRIYGTSMYIEELMLMNNIINPFSIVVGQLIEFVGQDDISYYRDPEETNEKSENIANPKNKNTRKDPNREKGVPPTIKPIGFKQILVDKKNKSIRINNKLS